MKPLPIQFFTQLNFANTVVIYDLRLASDTY